MAYSQTVTASVARSTSSADVSNLNNSIFISAHAFFQPRIASYSSMTEVNDNGIPKDSNVYLALQQAFSVNNPALPIYVGRQLVDSVTLAPVVSDTTTYSFSVQVFNTEDGTTSDAWEVSFPSGTNATAINISAGLDAAITTLSIATTEFTASLSDNTVLELVPATNRQLIVTQATAERFTQSYTVTETATTCFAAIQDENKEDYYFVTAESRDATFVADLAQAVGATTGSYPKQYRVSSDAVASLAATTDVAGTTDILQMIQDSEYQRTAGEWHEQSTTLFPELAACVAAGGYTAGTVNWKFLQNTAPAARHPILGRLLNTSEQGFIAERNASWVGKELGLSFMHGGTNATGTSEYTDLVQITDWVKVEMESRALTAIVNKNNGGLPLVMTSSDLNVMKDVLQGVLTDGVNLRLLSGFEEIVMPTNINFADQAGRILDNISFTAYFAAKVNFLIINGNLTYNEEIS